MSDNQLLEQVKQDLVDYFSTYSPLSHDESQAIKESIEIQLFKKGDILLEEDQISQECYFIYKGCIRQYCFIDTEEKTTNFFTENQSVFFQESTVNQTPCGFYLSCVEDCILGISTFVGRVS